MVDSAIEIMPNEEQTLINATIEVKDGQTVMKFTKLLKEPGQIEISMGLNNMLWAYGSSNTLSYHARRSPFTLYLSSSDVAIDSASPSFESSIAPSSASSLYKTTQVHVVVCRDKTGESVVTQNARFPNPTSFVREF